MAYNIDDLLTTAVLLRNTEGLEFIAERISVRLITMQARQALVGS